MIVTRDEFEKICCRCPLIGTVNRGNIKGLPGQQVLLREHFTDVCPLLLVSKDCANPESALWAARLLKRHMYYHLNQDLYEDYSDLFLSSV